MTSGSSPGSRCAGGEPRTASGPVYKGHDLPRLRGAMVSPGIDEAGLRVLGQQWNANLVRWQLVRHEKFDNPLDLAAYDRWLQSALKQLDAALPLCEKYGLRVVVDLHSPPGGRPPERRLRRIGPRPVHRRRLPAEVRRGLAAHGPQVQGRQGDLGLRPGQRAGRGGGGRESWPTGRTWPSGQPRPSAPSTPSGRSSSSRPSGAIRRGCESFGR